MHGLAWIYECRYIYIYRYIRPSWYEEHAKCIYFPRTTTITTRCVCRLWTTPVTNTFNKHFAKTHSHLTSLSFCVFLCLKQTKNHPNNCGDSTNNLGALKILAMLPDQIKVWDVTERLHNLEPILTSREKRALFLVRFTTAYLCACIHTYIYIYIYMYMYTMICI